MRHVIIQSLRPVTNRPVSIYSVPDGEGIVVRALAAWQRDSLYRMTTGKDEPSMAKVAESEDLVQALIESATWKD